MGVFLTSGPPMKCAWEGPPLPHPGGAPDVTLEARAELVWGVRGRSSLHSEFPRGPERQVPSGGTAAAQLASRAEPPQAAPPGARSPRALTAQRRGVFGASGAVCGRGGPPWSLFTCDPCPLIPNPHQNLVFSNLELPGFPFPLSLCGFGGQKLEIAA